MKERTIVVKGVGSATAPVDLIIITTNISTIDLDYEESFFLNNKRTKEFKDALINIGHDEFDIKTSNFNVNMVTESYKDSKGNYKSKFVGYNVSHKLKVEFPFDKLMLAKTIKAISKTEAHSNLSFTFSIKDEESLKKEVLRNAAINAREKAMILAEASKVTLGEVLNIDYSWKEVNIYSRSNFDIMMDYNVNVSADINPDDVQLEDVVTIIYSII